MKATFILLWICEKGRKTFNSFDFNNEEKGKPDAILDKFTAFQGPKSEIYLA